jgi:O-antigen ligase
MLSVALGLAISRGGVLAVPVAAVLLLYVALLVSLPSLALLSYAATRPMVEPWVEVQVGGLSLGELWGAGMLLTILGYLVLVRARVATRAPTFAIPIWFLVVYPILTFARPGFGTALEYELKAASWLLLALAVERCARTRVGQRQIATAGYVMAILLVASIGLAMAEKRYGAAYYSGQFSGSGQSPHGLISLAVLVLPFALIAVLRCRWVVVSSLIVAALSIEVLLSYVRTGYLSLAVILVGYGVTAFRRGGTPVVTSAFVAVMAIAVTVLIVGQEIVVRLSDLQYLGAGGSEQAQAGTGRIGFWTTVVHNAFDSVPAFLVGGGAGESIALIHKATGEAAWSHNDFIDFVATGGIVLLLAYLALLGWAYASLWRLRRDPVQSAAVHDFAAIGLATCVAFTTLSVFNGIALSQLALPFALLLGLGRGMYATPGRTFLDEERGPSLATSLPGMRAGPRRPARKNAGRSQR